MGREGEMERERKGEREWEREGEENGKEQTCSVYTISTDILTPSHSLPPPSLSLAHEHDFQCE